MLDLIWLVPALPLAGAAINLFFGKRLGKAAGALAAAVMTAAFVIAVFVVAELLKLPAEQRAHVRHLWEWIASGSFRVGVDLLVDPLSATMILVVTGVGTLIHIYAIGYMDGDPRYGRFFSYLNLFVFFMLMLVLAQNYLLLYLGWEGVGLCSYLLIGFWYERASAANAAKKAFITTRIGDTGMMIGIALIFVKLGTLDFGQVLGPGAGRLSEGAATAIALLLFAGAVGKSAQIPLHVWLPDAMEGPTPVSALIHAATMVTAGVYLVARSHALFEASTVALPIVLVVGLATALYAALASIGQFDIKRALAYSTMSQLGFMFFAAGMGYYAGAMLLLVCHAFYKALLFLSAGSVMHGTGDEADMRNMGGLAREMPATTAAFTVGALALAGIPPLAGFFAKDHIVSFAATSGRDLAWVLASVGAFLSALYITRPVFMAFFGTRRAEGHAHESPPVMTVPLALLAVGAVGAGVLGLSVAGGFLARFLEPSVGTAAEGAVGPSEAVLVGISVALAILAVAVAWYVWGSGRVDWLGIPERHPGLAGALGTAFYINALYSWLVQFPGKGFGRLVARGDEQVIDGMVNDVGAGVERLSRVAPRWETGRVRSYALSFAVGAFAVLVVLGLRL